MARKPTQHDPPGPTSSNPPVSLEEFVGRMNRLAEQIFNDELLRLKNTSPQHMEAEKTPKSRSSHVSF